MAGSTSKSASLSLKEYLKRYETTIEDPKKKKKKKKSKPDSTGVRVVDEDPVWQKPVKIEEEDDDSADEEKPQIDEDIEVKRMKRLEEIRLRRPYLAVSEDGSGWVSISNDSKESHSNDAAMLNPEPFLSNSDSKIADLSPPQRQQAHSNSVNETFDLSPPRRRQKRRDTPSPGHPSAHLDHDLSSPRRSRTETSSVDAVPDMSPPRRRQRRADTPSPEPEAKRPNSVSANRDWSPPRRSRTQISSPDLSPPRRGPRQTTEIEKSHVSSMADLSPPRKNKNDSSSAKMARRAGLFSGKEIKEEIDKKRKEELLRFSEMDPSISGRGAEAVYRDKHGKRISKEYFKLNQGEEKPKEKKLEWGKGLTQKREAEAREHELELEKEKPFARTRDDPELDKMLKERVRWGDPMAHLVKPKNTEPLLEDLGESEKMKESGFVIPQTIPSHSWIKRGIDPPANRYGIKPGRHWDGVDRSNGYEKESFKRQNEKQATEREAYLWSVSEM